MAKNKNKSETIKDGTADVDNTVNANADAHESANDEKTGDNISDNSDNPEIAETATALELLPENDGEKPQAKNTGKTTSPFKIAFTLGAIAVITAFMLAALNKITAPVIQARRDEEKAQAVSELFGGDMSNTLITKFEGELSPPVTEVLLLNNSTGEFIGYCVSAQSNGFGGKINILAAVDADKKILGVSILDMNETAGIGTQVRNDSFLSQFKGKSGDISVSSIDTISGATISSKAVLNGINAALNGIKDATANAGTTQPSTTSGGADALPAETTTEAETSETTEAIMESEEAAEGVLTSETADTAETIEAAAETETEGE